MYSRVFGLFIVLIYPPQNNALGLRRGGVILAASLVACIAAWSPLPWLIFSDQLSQIKK